MAHLLSLSTVLLLLAGFSLAQLIAFLPPNSSPEHNTPPAVVGHTDLSIRQHRRHDSGSEYAPAPGPTPEIKADLLDIVLLASVDGKLHALNRTSGKALWSMSSSVSGTVPTTFGPLIRTQHPEFDPEATDDDREVYVIEPQSGEIYVMSSPTSPLQRLPFSMSQLVDMSPFSFATEGDDRVFVGYKKTSLLLVELETGKVKATLGAECPWDPFEDLVPEEKEYDDVDLDELEAVNPPRRTSKPTEVFIGRTDYHISIYTGPFPPVSRTPIQNLSFSTYGPNNQDHGLQAVYRRTADGTYIESLPNGKIISFRTDIDLSDPSIPSNANLLWAQGFPSPVVAVFDVLKSPDRPQPFVLLQPRPRIQDILPSFDISRAGKHNLESAYVGIVEETQSLYAMSPDRYPLVIFGDANSVDDGETAETGLGRSIDPPPPSWDLDPSSDTPGSSDLPADVDSIARKTKWKRLCHGGKSRDIRCLTGVKRLESSALSRLLDGAPAEAIPSHQNHNNQVNDEELGGPGVPQGPHNLPTRTGTPGGNTSIIPDTGGWRSNGEVGKVLGRRWIGMDTSGQAFSAFAICVVALLTALAWIGFKKRYGVVDEKKGENVARESTMKAILNVEEVGQQNGKVEDGQGREVQLPAVDQSESNTGTGDARIPGSSIPTSSPPDQTPSIPTDPQYPSSAPTLTPSSSSKTVSFQPQDEPNPREQKPTPEQPDQEEVGDGGEESEGDAPITPGKRKGPRRRRGKKKKGGATGAGANAQEEGGGAAHIEGQGGADAKVESPGMEDEFVHVASPSAIVVPPPRPPTNTVPSLVVSDTILGFGSHGTVVFKGSLQGRAVAVKRLLQDFVTVAQREVTLLQESDDHPNVIRYYYQESHSNFLYIALELCPASLADVVERPDQFRDITVVFDPKKALRQITRGLRHLHALKIVHRDIKPQNILISHAKKTFNKGTSGGGDGNMGGHRLLISDFGLCKKLEVDQTSFLPTAHGAGAAGTVGWRAPEILRGEVKLDDVNEESLSSRGSVASGIGSSGTPTGKPTRLTKAVDIFALGCLFYYVLTNGGHPFGDRFEREVNILKNVKWLEGLDGFGEEGSEAVDLIEKMLSPDAQDRPDTSTCLIHPYFWDPGKRLNFLQDASDRFEIMCRDPRDPNLEELERGAVAVVGNDWNARLDRFFVENLGKFRKYDGKSVQDLLRALRNKKHHYQDLPDGVKRQVGPMPEGFLSYFTRRFPRLFLHVHSVIAASPLRQESMFRTYFELSD